MNRLFSLSILSLFALAACESTTQPMRMGADGRPLPVVYRIGQNDISRVQVRMRDAVNTLRAQSGLPALELNAQLTSAAATHARDMSVQQRPWHFGSDGSSPVDRARRAGYSGTMTGELISETFETELETLNAWMGVRETRVVLLDPRPREMGFAFHQDANGKLWWALVMGQPAGGIAMASAR